MRVASMYSDYVLSIDQGTTGTTVVIIGFKDSGSFNIVGRATASIEQFYPHTSWVEHDLNDIWLSVSKATIDCIEETKKNDAGFSVDKIVSLGICNQRETICVLERKTMMPMRRAIVWQCKRSANICLELKNKGLEPEIQKRTGLLCDPYFSGSKVAWVLEHEKDLAQKIHSGEAVICTIDSYLIARLTGGKEFVTEPSNASRTLFYDMEKGDWHQSLLDIFGLKNTKALPRIQDSAGLFGRTKGAGFLPDGIAISGVLGDQQAALAGQGCFEPGQAKCTYGTGAFLLLQLGDAVMSSRHKLLTTVSWSLGGKRSYALEGSAFIAGAAVQFIRDQMQLIKSASDTEFVPENTIAAPDVYFVPSLAGLGAPWWNPEAKGAFLGLTRGTDKNQLILAALEGLAFQVNDLLSAMQKDAHNKMSVLRVDGGASANNRLLQIQSDFSQIRVERPTYIETTALGAGLFAALGCGLLKDLNHVSDVIEIERTFDPNRLVDGLNSVSTKLSGWVKAVEAVSYFAR